MTRQKWFQLGLTAAIWFALCTTVSPALAQQPDSQQPQPPAPKTDPPPSSAKSDKDKKEDEQPGATVGKSKLEKETGTVNDRIFEVIPNYGTVENANALPPLSTGQKFRIASASVFDWGSFAFNGGLSAIAQARNNPKEWGQGWDAYGKRFGANFADNNIGTYMTVAVFPSLFHEDPRYYQMGKGGFWRRSYHAVNRLFVTRTDSGKTHFNYSESIGNAAAAALSNIYHVPSDRTASRNATTFAFLIVYDGLSNGLKEFWPDIRRKVFRKNTP